MSPNPSNDLIFSEGPAVIQGQDPVIQSQLYMDWGRAPSEDFEALLGQPAHSQRPFLADVKGAFTDA